MGRAQKDWLGEYLEYTKDNEAPELFHKWSGVSIIGHVLGRKCYLDRGYFQTYPGQLMVILVGPPAVRKSTAINIAGNLVRKVPSVRIVSDKLSARTLIEQMDRGEVYDERIKGTRQANSEVLVLATELAAFLPKQNYVEEIIPLLTKLSDAEDDFHYQTIAGGDIFLYNPLVSLLAASTPDWLSTSIPESSYGGGFMSRLLFVFQDSSPRINARPERNANLDRLRTILTIRLLKFAELEGPFEWSKGAEKWWDAFYKKWKANPNLKFSGFLGGYAGRRPEHMLRVAMVMAVSARNELLLTAPDLIRADQWLKEIEDEHHRIFETFGSTPLAGIQDRILAEVYARGPQPERDIYRKIWRTVSKDGYRSAIESLVEAKHISRVSQGGSYWLFPCVPPVGDAHKKNFTDATHGADNVKPG